MGEEKVTLERNTSKTVTYTLIYAEGTTVRYFAEIQGQYYEINFDNGNITISTEETSFGDATREAEVTVESSYNDIIEAAKIEEGKLLLTAKDAIGDVEITVKEINTNTTKKFTATTKIPVTSITVSTKKTRIKVEETINLIATVEPSNAIDKTVLWSSSDTSVAMVSDSGIVTAVALGTAIITASAEDGSGIISNACIITVSEPTMLDKVKENPLEYYGKKVAGYDVNGVSDWRIFYADEENVFIIMTDYLLSEKAIACNSTMASKGKYAVYWGSEPTSTSSTINVGKFSPITTETIIWSGNYGASYIGKCVSTLLDTNKWVSFVDTVKAEMAIGSPTLNMWVASWNTKYPTKKIYCNNSNEKGYFIGDTDRPTNYHISMSQSVGYQVFEEDNMYYPHKSEIDEKCCQGYFLSSSGTYEIGRIMQVCYDGGIGDFNYYGWFYAVRPVVCLKSDVQMIENSDGTVTIK